MNKGIFALALGTFALGITEFIMMGILGVLANSLDVSITAAGHLISAYASGVCVGAPVLLFARSVRLRTIMLVLAAMIMIGNTLTACAPGYWSMMAARFISGLPHGAYFGVGAIVARKLCKPGHETSAVALMIGGMTVATIGGVPLGTFITETVSWRVAFAIVAVCGLATFVAIRAFVPKLDALPPEPFTGQFRFLKTAPPWLIFGGVIFGQIGLYCWYSFIDPQMTEVAGFSVSDLPWLMVLAGVGMFLGNIVAGKFGDRYAPALVACIVQGCGILVLIAFYYLVGVPVLAVALMMLGTASLFGSGGPLQSSIVGYSKGGEMLGAACIQIAYNAGNAIAAWLGGMIIAQGYSYTAPALVGVPIVAVGCILLYVLYRRYEAHGKGSKSIN